MLVPILCTHQSKTSCDRKLPEELPTLRQTLVVLCRVFPVVVDEPDQPHPDEREQRKQALFGKRVEGDVESGTERKKAEVGGEVAEGGSEDDDHAPHRRGAQLVHVALNVVLDELPDVAIPQKAHGERGSEDREDEGDARRNEQLDHAWLASISRTASRSSPADLDALTSTIAPSSASSRTMPTASD